MDIENILKILIIIILITDIALSIILRNERKKLKLNFNDYFEERYLQEHRQNEALKQEIEKLQANNSDVDIVTPLLKSAKENFKNSSLAQKQALCNKNQEAYNAMISLFESINNNCI